MLSNKLHYQFALAAAVATLSAAPLIAQQAQPARRPLPQTQPRSQYQPQSRAQAAPQHGAQAPSPSQAAPPRGTAPAGQYPVRRTAANEPVRTPSPAPGTATPGAPVTGEAVTGAPLISAPPPRAPFVLTPQQQSLLDVVLLKWEKQSDRINTFSCKFTRWEVNETFGPADHNFILSQSEGDLKYKSPDNGSYIVSKQTEWDKAKGNYVARSEGLDHWVCDGKSIYEFDHTKKELIERQLAPEMQGKAITDGPLPFVFGTKADQLNRRYWMRDITPTADVGKKVWLEAWPKFARDAANYQHAIIILNEADFVPSGLRIILPDGKNKQDYIFDKTQVNNPLAILASAFAAPYTPFGWKKVVIPAGGSETAPPAEGPAAATLPGRPATR